MKGLSSSSKFSSCFGSIISGSFSALCFYCSFSTPTKPPERPIEREKPCRHIPTRSASSFSWTTTSPTVQQAEEPVPDDIALRDLDPDLAMALYDEGLAELVVPHGCITDGLGLAGSAEDEHPSEAVAPHQLPANIGASDEAVRDRAAPDEIIPEISGAEMTPATEVALVAGKGGTVPPNEGCSDITPTKVRSINSKHWF